MPLTIRDIAKIAGVSPATVSRYFSGSDVVSKDTARKIENALKELGYTPRFKKCTDNGVIAVLIPNLQLGFYGEVLKELIEEIPKYNYRIVFIPTIPDSEQNRNHICHTSRYAKSITSHSLNLANRFIQPLMAA